MSQASTYVAQPTTNWVNHSQLLDENFTLKDMHYGQEAPEIKEEEVFLNQSLHSYLHGTSLHTLPGFKYWQKENPIWRLDILYWEQREIWE